MDENVIEVSETDVPTVVSEDALSDDPVAVLDSSAAEDSADVSLVSDLETAVDSVSSGDVSSPAAVTVVNAFDYSDRLAAVSDELITLSEEVAAVGDSVITCVSLLTLIAGLALFFWCHARIRNAVRAFTGRWHND